MLDYRGHVKRYLVYCLRTGRLSYKETRTTHGVEFNPEQRQLLDRVSITTAKDANAARLARGEIDTDNEAHQRRCRVLDRAVFEF